MTIISSALFRLSLGAGLLVKINFDKDTEKSYKVNGKVLLKILKRNCKSEVGIKYDFKSIKGIEDFKNKFPITNYDFYTEYIEKMIKGEENILFSEKIEYFGHTSGTTGKQKLIPTTKTSRTIASKYMALLLNRFAYDNLKEQWSYGRGLMISDMVTTTYTDGGVPICSATSGGMKAIKNIIKYMYTSPIEVMEIEDKDTANYLHLLFALKEKNLSYIGAPFISNILDLFRILEDNYKDLTSDIKKGKINRKLNLDDDIRKKLNNFLEPNAGRANELEREFSKGFKGIIRNIWPKAIYIATVTGANFSIYDDKVNYYTDYIPIYSPVYASTEATIGINPYIKKIRYVIIPDTVFYEFIPFEEINEANPTTLLINELKVGEKYEIVITNYAGLYRYRLGDIVKVVSYYNDSPEIEFLFRKNQVLNMVSEKTNEEQLTSAIKSTMSKLSLSLVDYTTMPDNSVTPGRYIFYCEFKEKLSKESVKLLEENLDKELRKSNLAYDRARNNKKLGDIKMMTLKNHTFKTIKESLFEKGVSKNQIKIPRVIINNKVMLDIINKNIIKF
ncbi:MAG: GH3 auxin-responsive promoter family protein [Clostridium perfringens]|nr:GH3 auxin-responsive promoter family protein [Clostridium perfringens]